MPDQKLTALTALATLSADDLFYVVDDPAGAATSRKMAASVLDARYLRPVDIGATVQAWDADLDTIAGLAKADGNFIVGDGAAWTVESGATVRTSLGLGSIATQAANSVSITGGSITGITDLAIADGGTGQSTAQAAIDALTAVAGATNEHVLTKDTATGNAIFKAAGGGSSLPVADTQTIVMGSADNTKLLRFEIDGFSAGATRVMTPPNQDTTLAGQDFANVFSVAQTIQAATATVIPLTIKTTDDSTTNPLTRWISSTSASIAYIQKGEFWLLNTLTAPASLIAANRPTVLFADTKAATAAGFVLQNQAANGYSEITIANNNAGASSFSRLTFGVGGTTAQAPYGNAGYLINFQDLDALRIETRKTGSEIRFYAGHATNISHSIASDVSRFYMRDGGTNTLTYFTLDHPTTATPTTTFGVALLCQGQSSTSVGQNMGRLSWEWATATHASRKALGRLTAYDISTEREAIQWGVDGSNPTLGFLGATRIPALPNN